jgi:hypothetical protein
MSEKKQKYVVTGHKGIWTGRNRRERKRVKPGGTIELTDVQARAFRDRIRPVGSRAKSSGGGSPRSMSRAALEAELLAAGYDPAELVGTGQRENVVKDDLAAAVELIRAGQEPNLVGDDEDKEPDEDEDKEPDED